MTPEALLACPLDFIAWLAFADACEERGRDRLAARCRACASLLRRHLDGDPLPCDDALTRWWGVGWERAAVIPSETITHAPAVHACWLARTLEGTRLWSSARMGDCLLRPPPLGDYQGPTRVIRFVGYCTIHGPPALYVHPWNLPLVCRG